MSSWPRTRWRWCPLHTRVLRSHPALDQAAFDLQCTKEQLTVQKLSDDHQFMGVKNTTWGVQGCENRGTYKSSCGLGNCQVMSESKAQQR